MNVSTVKRYEIIDDVSVVKHIKKKKDVIIMNKTRNMYRAGTTFICRAKNILHAH